MSRSRSASGLILTLARIAQLEFHTQAVTCAVTEYLVGIKSGIGKPPSNVFSFTLHISYEFLFIQVTRANEGVIAEDS